MVNPWGVIHKKVVQILLSLRCSIGEGNGIQSPNKSYEVHTALWEDLNEGWIWIKDEALKDKLQNQRRIVRINSENQKKVYSEALYVENFYLERFNERMKPEHRIPSSKDRLIFISGWYRNILGIKVQEIRGQKNLTITPCKFPCSLMWQLSACLQHPQVVVFLGTNLAIIGLGLGGIAVGLGLITIQDLCSLVRYVAIAFVLGA